MSGASRKILSLAVLAAFASGTPAAGAERGERLERASRRAGCDLQIGPGPASAPAGEAVTLTGSLTCPFAAEAAGQLVTVYEHIAGTRGANPVGTASTAADGSFSFATGELSSNSSFSFRIGSMRSRRVTIRVTPLVTISGPSTLQALPARRHADVLAGVNDAVTFRGTVAPARPGARVILQRESAGDGGERWRPIAFSTVAADGTYAVSHAFGRAGTTVVRVVVRSHGVMTAASETLSYEVAQRQNSRLTIHASPDHLDYGQSVRVDGVASAAPGQTLTLLARGRGGSFAPVATVQAGADGGYSFPAQQPPVSTSYEVTAGRLHSTTLLVAVAPLLEAQVSANAVASGETVVFSGTVTPGQQGEPVYLERRDASGLAFHVVATGALDAGGAFSFERQLSGAGSQVYRVKAPRFGGREAVAGAALTVVVS